jgi:hypothetical protein
MICVLEDLLSQYLLNGDLGGFINAVYLSILGEAWYVIPYFILFTLIYIKTESLEYCAILWILLSGLLLYTVPAQAATVGALFLVLGIAIILYRLAAQVLH